MSQSSPVRSVTEIRHNWSREELDALYEMPFNDLLFQAQQVHREFFNANEIQVSTLLSIKTGSCPEDCGYCPQSAHHSTGLEKERLLAIQEVLKNAKEARANGASRFCMGAAWRKPNDADFQMVLEMVKGVKAEGLETCMTLGMLTEDQAQQLNEAGLDYYNHNLDSSREFYGNIITTRTYDDRLDTIRSVRKAGLKVCAGGIIGMGESRTDRIGLLLELANMEQHPESVPVNMLVKVPGTPLESVEDLDPIEFVRTIAIARLIMPESYVRLSAGREEMTDELQALCYLAGANSIFYGDKLLTAGNASTRRDDALFDRLGLNADIKKEHDHTGGTDQGPMVYGNACASH